MSEEFVPPVELETPGLKLAYDILNAKTGTKGTDKALGRIRTLLGGLLPPAAPFSFEVGLNADNNDANIINENGEYLTGLTFPLDNIVSDGDSLLQTFTPDANDNPIGYDGHAWTCPETAQYSFMLQVSLERLTSGDVLVTGAGLDVGLEGFVAYYDPSADMVVSMQPFSIGFDGGDVKAVVEFNKAEGFTAGDQIAPLFLCSLKGTNADTDKLKILKAGTYFKGNKVA